MPILLNMLTLLGTSKLVNPAFPNQLQSADFEFATMSNENDQLVLILQPANILVMKQEHTILF